MLTEAVIEAIRAARKRKNWTQADLAAAIGMPNGQTYISEFERGERPNITLDTLKRMAAALDLQLDISTTPVPAESPAA